ncbi:ATP/GTP-binding protein [Streptomyces sp. NPDC127068]|uniref:ATP/GTP-binding protein n=1 Tax=Streptomyces sp. NPDC127068 TaxID=3347127 RepID=UPI003648E9A5
MADNLRALFSSNDPSFDANEAFTNREHQWALVAGALEQHLRRTGEPGFDVEDLETPRSNVLVFHGVGGVGKSTLLRKIEAALTAADQRPAQWGAPSWTDRLLPVRIDLARSASTGSDFERVVLTIRLALAGSPGRPLPAFDVALRRYWEHTHPGEPLDEYLRRTGLVGRFATALPQQLQTAVGEAAALLQLPGGATAGQVTGALVQGLRERRERARALAGCPHAAGLLEATPDLEALSFYPHLLAWELDELPAKYKVTPVVLLDTFEDTADRHRDFERLLQRLVYLMPNVLFVISGRSRLAWADPALHGQLDWTGPAAWPGLTPGAGANGRQHLIGDLSPEDCDDHLARRLVHDGRPLIEPGIRAAITARSHGLPLHLDLAVARFLEIRRTGRTPEPADFDHSFPALIARILSDLTPDERHVLRSASLLDAFDLDLATRAAGIDRHAPARQLTQRPLVSENPYALWPYHLHGAIRTALRNDQTEDHWSPADWHQAAGRALAALGEQWATASAPSRMLLVACLRQGLRLARDHQLRDLGWLTDAAHTYTDDSVWEPLAPPTGHPGADDGGRDATVGGASDDGTGWETAADALAELLTAIARRQHEHRQRTADRLTAVLDTGLLDNELTALALYYRAKAHKDLGRTADSRTGMQQVADAGGRLAPKARRGLANLDRISGGFPAALAAVPTLGWKGRHHRVHGDIHWPHGHTSQAIAAFEAGRTEAEQHDAPGERAITQTRLALVTAFADPVRAGDELDLAHQLLAPLDQRATTLLAHVAGLIKDAGHTDSDVPGRAHGLRRDITDAGLPWLIRFLELALAFHHAVRDEHQDLADLVDRLHTLTAGGDFAYLADIAAAMGNLPHPPRPTVHWLHGHQPVRERWRELVTDRRAHLNASS